MAGEAPRWDSGEEQPSPCYWNTEDCVQGWGRGGAGRGKYEKEG